MLVDLGKMRTVNPDAYDLYLKGRPFCTGTREIRSR
jgi:hypothetical protein